jgi:hypothetical protein
LAEKQREFNAQLGLADNTQAMTAQSALNRAPLADKAQYLALNQAAPTAFQPRDYTQAGGLSNLSTPASGGAAKQLQTNAIAANNYTPGAGGVDTSTLQTILARLKAANPAPTGFTPTGPYTSSSPSMTG